jgi:hypothetical protein
MHQHTNRDAGMDVDQDKNKRSGICTCASTQRCVLAQSQRTSTQGLVLARIHMLAHHLVVSVHVSPAHTRNQEWNFLGLVSSHVVTYWPMRTRTWSCVSASLKAVQYLQHARPRLLSMPKVRRVGKSRSLKRGVPGSNPVRVCQQIK